MKKPTQILIYVLYALVTCVLFLYLLFPSDLVIEIITEKLAQTRSNIEMKTDTVRPTLSLGLNFQPISFYFAGKPFIRSENVKLRPHLFTLFGNTKTFSFKGPLGNGHFSGRVELVHKSKRTQGIISVDLNEIPLEAIALFKQWPNFAPIGSLDGQLNYDSLKGGSGRVDADIDIAPIRVVINPPLMGLEALEFTEIQAEFSATQRQLTIKKCEAFGSQIEGKITGFVALRQPLGSSRPTLTVSIKPQQAFITNHKNDIIGGMLSSAKTQKRGVVIRVSGTLDNPSYVIR